MKSIVVIQSSIFYRAVGTVVSALSVTLVGEQGHQGQLMVSRKDASYRFVACCWDSLDIEKSDVAKDQGCVCLFGMF